MSRVGKTPISVPKDVQVKVNDNLVSVKGKLGELSYELLPGITVTQEENQLIVNREDDSKPLRARHGLTRALVNNMVVGVSEGYEKVLHLIGTGYSAEVISRWLKLSIGYSHEILIEIPDHLTVESEPVPRAKGSRTAVQAIIKVKGISKEDVGKFAAEVRACRPPINYNTGKGIRYSDEYVKIKPGKSGAA
jgi:large subunit ribosomal protein L6